MPSKHIAQAQSRSRHRTTTNARGLQVKVISQPVDRGAKWFEHQATLDHPQPGKH